MSHGSRLPRRPAAVMTLLTAFVLSLPADARAQTPQPSARSADTAAPAGASRSLSLVEALRMAEQASPTVQIARASVAAAAGQQEQARSQFFPQLNGSASYTRTLKSQFSVLAQNSDTTTPTFQSLCSPFIPQDATPAQRAAALQQAQTCAQEGGLDFTKVGFGSKNQYNLGLSLTQNVFAGGRITARYRAAAAGREAAAIGLTASRAQMVLDVAQAYYDAQLADRLFGIAQATLAQAETTLSQTRLARQVGTQPEFELLRAQVQRENQVPVVMQRSSDREIAYLRLKQLLDIPLEQPLVLTTDLQDTTSASATQLVSLVIPRPTGDTAVDDRAPVRQAAENVRAQREQLTIANAQRWPTITLSSQFGRVAFPNGFPSWSDFVSNWTVTAALSVPLLTFGGIHGQEVVARANLEQARAQLRQTTQLASLDTRSTLNQLATAQAQFAASVGTADVATRAYQIAEVRYREGISTQTELTDTRIQLEQAQANRAQAARNLQVARLRAVLLPYLPLSSTTGAESAAGTAAGAAAGTTVPVVPPSTTTPQGQPTPGVSASRTGQTGTQP